MINNNYSKNYVYFLLSMIITKIENLNYVGMIKEYVDQNQKSLDFKQTPSYKRFDKIISAVCLPMPLSLRSPVGPSKGRR